MTYEHFVRMAKEEVKNQIAADAGVEVYEAERNNGVRRKGLRFSKKDAQLSPIVYLEEYYERFCAGTPLEKIVRDIAGLCEDPGGCRGWDVGMLRDYARVRERVVFRIIGQRKNKAMLRAMPHRLYLDLAIVYYVLLETGKEMTATMAVRREHLRMWGVTEETLYRQAMENTPVLLAEEMLPLRECAGEPDEEETSGRQMYVMTNRMKSYGAAVLCYPDCLRRVGRYVNQSFYVLPSSIHEVIVLKDAAENGARLTRRELTGMVREINEKYVLPEEVLSDHAYYYDVNTGTLS